MVRHAEARDGVMHVSARLEGAGGIATVHAPLPLPEPLPEPLPKIAQAA